MKKLLFMLLLCSCVLVSPAPSKASAATANFDPPPILTWYLADFYHPGGNYLPAGNYQVLSNLYGDHNEILYLYDATNDISYECFSSTYDPEAGTATLSINSPIYGWFVFGTVSVTLH